MESDKMNVDEPSTSGQPPRKKFRKGTVLMGDSARENFSPMDPEDKVRAYNFILALSLAILKHIKGAKDNLLDNIQVAKIVMSLVDIQKQIFNNATEKTSQKIARYVASGQTAMRDGKPIPIPYGECKSFIAAAATSSHGSLNQLKENFGTVNSIAAHFGLFTERVNSCKYSNKGVTKTKAGGNTIAQPWSMFGVPTAARYLATGVNWSIPVKSGLSQSLSSIAAAITLVTTDKMYQDKWQRAVKNSLAFLPVVDQLVEYLSGATIAAAKTIIHKLCLIVSYVGDRSKQKGTGPIFFIADFLKEEGKETFDKDKIAAFDFSGEGYFEFYRYFMGRTIKVPKDASEGIWRQILFHSMVGTDVVDQGTLKFMTSGEPYWVRREEISIEEIQRFKFSRKSTVMDDNYFKDMKVVQLQYYSKMSSAFAVNLGNPTGKPWGSVHVFSGYEVKVLSKELMLALTDKTASITASSSYDSLVAALDEYISKVIATLGDNFKMGTTGWKKIEDAGKHTDNFVDDTPRNSGVNFWM